MFINQSFSLGYCDGFIHTPKLVRDEVIFKVSLEESTIFPNKLEITTHSRVIEGKQVYVICASSGLNLELHVTEDLELHNKIFSSLKIELENLNKPVRRLNAVFYQEELDVKINYLYLGFESIDLTLTGDSFSTYDHLESVNLDTRISVNIALDKQEPIYAGMIEINKDGVVNNKILTPGFITDSFVNLYKYVGSDFFNL